MIKRIAIMPMLCASLFFSGCASREPITITDPKIIVPYDIGASIGFIGGLPLTIVALPATIPLSEKYYDSNGGHTLIIFAPSVFTAQLVGSVFALPPLLLFGWWGQEDYS